MTDHLVVLLGERVIGEVVRSERRTLAFSYDDAYRTGPATPLSVTMPLSVERHDHDVVAPWLWGLLPDNERVLARWGREFQVSARDVFGLLAHMGEDCPGAVQFARPDRVVHATTGGSVEWVDDAHIADRLRTLRRDDSAWRPEHRSGRFSLAGAQAKFALLHDRGRWGEPSGRIPTTHIVKPGINELDNHPLNEHLCLRTAQNLGISAVNSQMVLFEDQPALVVERFDRVQADDQWVRVHQEDLCQALGVYPEHKYQSEHGPTVPDIARLIREQTRPKAEADRAIRHFADALAFNWLIGGTDAHAKNYCFLLSGPWTRLGPLYDLASHLPYDSGDYHDLRMAMKLGDKYRVSQVTAYEWQKTAQVLGLEQGQLLTRVTDLATRIPDALSDACSEVRHLDEEFPRRFLDAVAEAQPRHLSRLRQSWNPASAPGSE